MVTVGSPKYIQHSAHIESGREGLIFARCMQGICTALLVPGSLALISASFDEDSRGKAIGTWSGLTAITSASGS